MTVPTVEESLHEAESILALLHYRGIIDSQHNRDDVARALGMVRSTLDGAYQTYTARPVPVKTKRRWGFVRRNL